MQQSDDVTATLQDRLYLEHVSLNLIKTGVTAADTPKHQLVRQQTNEEGVGGGGGISIIRIQPQEESRPLETENLASNLTRTYIEEFNAIKYASQSVVTKEDRPAAQELCQNPGLDNGGISCPDLEPSGSCEMETDLYCCEATQTLQKLVSKVELEWYKVSSFGIFIGLPFLKMLHTGNLKT